MRAETAHAVLLLVVVAGLGFAVFAAAETYIPSLRSACSFNVFFSCSKVDNSAYTNTFTIPDWKIGVAGFLLLLALEVPLYLTWRRDLLTGVLVVSGVGVLVALYLGYVELAVIGALCPVCFGTYLLDGVAFLLSTWLFWKGRGSASTDDGAPASGESAESEPSASA
jgi:uncharacterized membrane protein